MYTYKCCPIPDNMDNLLSRLSEINDDLADLRDMVDSISSSSCTEVAAATLTVTCLLVVGTVTLGILIYKRLSPPTPAPPVGHALARALSASALADPSAPLPYPFVPQSELGARAKERRSSGSDGMEKKKEPAGLEDKEKDYFSNLSLVRS